MSTLIQRAPLPLHLIIEYQHLIQEIILVMTAGMGAVEMDKDAYLMFRQVKLLPVSDSPYL